MGGALSKLASTNSGDGFQLAVLRLVDPSHAYMPPVARRRGGSKHRDSRLVARFAACHHELCGRLGDEVDQAAWLAGIWMTSMPFLNLTPWTSFGN
jgi:hypothetical protein